MTERPILFKGPLVRAILDGTKTQTRRLVDMSVPMDCIGPKGLDNDPESWGFQAEDGHWYVLARGLNEREPHGMISIPCPHGEPGDRLWVREAWQAWMPFVSEYDDGDPLSSEELREGAPAHWEYQAGPTESLGPWRPSIHMPRRASRIDLEITEVRIERLWDITEEDAKAEGVTPLEHIADEQRIPGPGFDRARLGDQPHRFAFALKWEEIYGEEMWDSNPWVWVLSFRRIRP